MTVSADRPFRLPHQLLAACVGLVEFALITIGSASGPIIYAAVIRKPPYDVASVVGIGLLGGMLYLFVALAAGLYKFPVLAHASSHVGRILTTCGSVLLSLTAVLFILKIGSDFSRGAMLAFAAMTLVLCCLARGVASLVVGYLIERDLVRGRSIHLLGDGDELASLGAKYLLRQYGFSEVGRSVLPDADEDDRFWQDTFADALVAARDARAKGLLLAARLDRFETLARIEHAVRDTPLPLDLVPNKVIRGLLARNPTAQDSTAQLISLQRAPLSAFEQILKRAVDVAASLLLAILLSPLLTAAALAIKLDSSGPVFFRQRRVGFDRQPFHIVKFRTMHVLEDGPRIVQARRDDHRVTRVGRVLRRSSIDELPQLWNVIKGEMSLVGPRPHALSHDDGYGATIREYCRRHHVKPGITGWAQVNGLRGETRHDDDMRRRVDHDLWYIHNWSLRLDIRILLRTCVTLMGPAAY